MSAAVEWKPGDVAVLTHVEGSARRAMFFGDGKWRCENAPHDPHTPLDHETRPLVVIDPEDDEQMAMLAQAYLDNTTAAFPIETSVKRLRAALRSLIAPPKPDEPLDPAARVECRGAVWARVGEVWIANGHGALSWESLTAHRDDVRVVTA